MIISCIYYCNTLVIPFFPLTPQYLCYISPIIFTTNLPILMINNVPFLLILYEFINCTLYVTLKMLCIFFAICLFPPFLKTKRWIFSLNWQNTRLLLYLTFAFRFRYHPLRHTSLQSRRAAWRCFVLFSFSPSWALDFSMMWLVRFLL